MDEARAMEVVAAFSEQEDAFQSFLQGLHYDLWTKLRFRAHQAVPGDAELLKHPHANGFFAGIAQLLLLHVHYADQVKRNMTDMIDSISTGRSERVEQLKHALGEMLAVLRVAYVTVLIEEQELRDVWRVCLAQQSDGKKGVLAAYAATHSVLVQDVGETLKQRFVALAGLLDEVTLLDGAHNDDAAVDTHAPGQQHVAFVENSLQAATDERDLIQLQSRLKWPAQPDHVVDFFGQQLVMHEIMDVSTIQHDATVQCVRRKRRHVHCFTNGRLLCSREETDGQLIVEDEWRLKNDHVFVEAVPQGLGMDWSPGFTLVRPHDVTIFHSQNHADAWLERMDEYLRENEARGVALKKDRTSEALERPQEMKDDQENDKAPLLVFPQFHDDNFPGMLWHRAVGSKTEWALAELVILDKWLLVYQVIGWSSHVLLTHVRLDNVRLQVADKPMGERDWSLVITDSTNDLELVLATAQRYRVDFWFDQVSKAVFTAKTEAERRREESEQRGLQTEEENQQRVEAEEREQRRAAKANQSPKDTTAEEDAVGDHPFISVRKKKRSRNTTVVDGESEPAPGHNAEAAGNTDPNGEMKASSGEKDNSSNGIENTVMQSQAVKASAKASAGNSARKRKQSTESAGDQLENDIGASVTMALKNSRKRQKPEDDDNGDKPSPTAADPSAFMSPIRNPKQRWLKRKHDDPTDAALIQTQSSQESPATKPSRSSKSPKKTPRKSPPTTPTTADKTSATIRIILTGLEPTATIRKKIKAIAGAVYEDDINKATHVIAPRDTLKRTVKLLCGISRCSHILDERWLDESARVGAAVYERAHCLKDAKAEAKWGFDLVKTMYDFTPRQRRQLFVGHRVFITNHKSILPPVKDLARIVECAGGEAVTTGAAGPNDLVITSDAAMSSSTVQKTLTGANPQRMYTTELILSSILQQEIEFDRHRLGTGASGRAGKRR
ncbi:TPA: hypothetical protein N0F65_005343 [Lagenidium giganteum]|uniref:BRCT domain-containing protein n=1 Tax=Lagenidium giganteum TaxID=4803 RepID=A0AAV2YY38_9STRA|nr:TPA: hypothetical protein N0F65_005343 [Lagenidium giganteum]